MTWKQVPTKLREAVMHEMRANANSSRSTAKFFGDEGNRHLPEAAAWDAAVVELKRAAKPARRQKMIMMQDNVTRSGLMTVVVERDFEEAPDDEHAWIVVLACAGDSVPEHFGGGYLHVPGCDCTKDDGSLGKNCGALCDVGWLQEFVSCVGAWPLIRDIAEKEDRAARELYGTSPDGPIRVRLVGKMVSERFDTQEGTDYDERFDVERAEAA